MSRNSLERHASIDAQLRLLAPGKVSEDDKLVEYDALLVDRFLDILQCLHGEDLREMVQECYEISAKYEGTHDLSKLDELGNVLMSLDPWDSILLPSSFSHMLNLGNLAEEVQIAHRGRNFQIEKAFKLLSSAILRGLIIATRQRYSCIKVQSDSKVAIDIINGNASAPWTCWPTLSRIRAITNKHSIHFSFVHRQANQPADYLSHASHHISAEDTIIRPGDFPQQLQNLITRDKQQMAYIRI